MTTKCRTKSIAAAATEALLHPAEIQALHRLKSLQPALPSHVFEKVLMLVDPRRSKVWREGVICEELKPLCVSLEGTKALPSNAVALIT